MTSQQYEIFRKCLGAVETGGQVYGNARYNCYVGKATNSTKETALTIGAYGFYGTTAKTIVSKILEKHPTVFRKNDTAGIEKDLSLSWSIYDPGVGSAKAKCIQKIISTPEGVKVQDDYIDELLDSRVENMKAKGVSDLDALFFCAEIIHLGGNSAMERVLKKTSKPYTLDNIYAALKTDQADKSSNNQVGDTIYWSRHEKIYKWLKQYVTNNSKEDIGMSITEKNITLCGHGSGTPSTKNMYTYLSTRYSSLASNGKRKGVVSVKRLKALTDAGRTSFHDTYKTILGRNIYSQTLRSYVYTSYNGKYYSDCSSSGCATFKKIGYNVSLLNTAGIYQSSLFETVPVNISNGHITNPEVLKVGDAILFVGNDPSRPLQIGHVEFVYEINGSSTSNSTSSSTSTTSYLTSSTVLKKGSTGAEVKQLQEDLISLGYSCGSSGADGDFGANTDSAVRSFQKSNGLTVDGQVGSNTKAKITAIKAAMKNTSTSSNSGTTSSSSSTYGKRISEYKVWLMKYYTDTIKKVCGFELSNSEAWGTNCEKATITIWKDVMNRKYGTKLTLGNYNFASSCKASAVTLKEGDSGTLVAIIQGILAAKGYYNGTISANYDKTLTEAIKAFQKARKITCDGICGANTWYALFN